MRKQPATPITSARQGLSFETRHFGIAQVITSSYQNGGKLAVELVDQNGEPIAMLSVNIPESSHMLGENEFFAKTWSENEEIAEEALQSGIFRDTGRTSDGFLKAKIWAFS
jgi:hypothetical protein